MDAYQRGNRDGLISIAKWAESKSKEYRLEYEELSMGSTANSLSKLRYDLSIVSILKKSEAYKELSICAYRMSESLPIDPELKSE